MGRVLCATILALVSPLAAEAATVQFSDSLTAADDSGFVIARATLPLYSGAGTLTGATLTYRAWVQATADGDAGKAFSDDADEYYGICNTDAVLYVEINHPPFNAFESNADSSGSTCAPGLVATANLADTILAGSNLSGLIGTGTFDVRSYATSDAFNVLNFGSALSLFAEVIYTYDPIASIAPVPLPAGLPLMLAGVGAFGLAARRRAG